MSTFTTRLRTDCLDDGRFELVEEFDFASDTLERIVRIPVGFVTDFASIPPPFCAIWPPTGPYGKAAVVHDMLYQHPECLTPRVTWMQANRTLLEGMSALRVGLVTRYAIFWGVCLGGWVTWLRYRRQERRSV
jgi:hypothetical protein